MFFYNNTHCGQPAHVYSQWQNRTQQVSKQVEFYKYTTTVTLASSRYRLTSPHCGIILYGYLVASMLHVSIILHNYPHVIGWTFWDEAMLNARGRSGPVISNRYSRAMLLAVCGKSPRTWRTSNINEWQQWSLMLITACLVPATVTTLHTCSVICLAVYDLVCLGLTKVVSIVML